MVIYKEKGETESLFHTKYSSLLIKGVKCKRKIKFIIFGLFPAEKLDYFQQRNEICYICDR